jgi:ABC-2 type transport system permease protein
MISTTSLETLTPARRPEGGKDSEHSLGLLALQTWVQTKRILNRWSLDIFGTLASILLPPLIMAGAYIVFGDLIYLVTHDNALYTILPLLLIGAAISGSNFVVLDLMRERNEGLLTRLWVLPVHRASGLLARGLAEAIRITLTAAALLAAAVAFGFRFREGAAAGVMWVVVPAVLSMAFAALFTMASLYTSEILVVEAVALFEMLFLALSGGVVPRFIFPGWIQPVVMHQPVTYATLAMRGLSAGGPVLFPTVMTFLWSAGILAACAVPLVRGYRRASTN